eukprot:6221906-Alexandrium_andersonii.AAC.1
MIAGARSGARWIGTVHASACRVLSSLGAVGATTPVHKRPDAVFRHFERHFQTSGALSGAFGQ